MIDEKLLTDLKDKNFRVRVQAVDTLVKSGEPQAVEILLKALGDSSYTVRKHAAVGLARSYREPRVLEALINEVKHCDNWNYSRSLHNAFVKFGKGAYPFLLEKLDDPDEKVRSFAARLLAEKKVKAALDPLLKQLWGEVPTIRNMTKPTTFDTPPNFDGARYQRLMNLLDTISHYQDTRVLDLLLAAYVPGGFMNMPVVQAVARFDEARVLPWLKQRLQDEDYEVRFQAARALQQRGDPDIEEVIERDPMLKMQMRAQQAYHMLHQDNSLEGLQGLAEQFKDILPKGFNIQSMIEQMQNFVQQLSKNDEDE